jgi:hypothetical protein
MLYCVYIQIFYCDALFSGNLALKTNILCPWSLEQNFCTSFDCSLIWSRNTNERTNACLIACGYQPETDAVDRCHTYTPSLSLPLLAWNISIFKCLYQTFHNLAIYGNYFTWWWTIGTLSNNMTSIHDNQYKLSLWLSKSKNMMIYAMYYF